MHSRFVVHCLHNKNNKNNTNCTKNDTGILCFANRKEINMENTKSIAAIISTARRARGLTQGQLAAQLGINRTTLALWELGRTVPSFNNMQKLVDCLELPHELLQALDKGRHTRRLDTTVGKLQRQIDAITQLGGGDGLTILLDDAASVATLCKALVALEKMPVGSPQYLVQLKVAFNAAITVFQSATKGGGVEK